jgi:hypothetical protein
MVKDEKYYFHQTPPTLAKKLIAKLDLVAGDKVLEPFRGEGAFYNELPDFVIKEWTEIEEGRDYADDKETYDWVLSNPPFRLVMADDKRVNSFWKILLHYTTKTRKGIAFLGNDYCLSTLTTTRMKILNDLGWYLHGIEICSVRRWRGRYFFLTFRKTPNPHIGYVEGNH